MPGPFRITCYDRARLRTGWIGDAEQVTATVGHNEISTATITLRHGHDKTALLWTRGARVVIDYDAGNGWEHLLSGPVRPKSVVYDPSTGAFTVTVEDDLRLLWRILGWPNPANPIGSQTSRERSITGPAETVAKTYVTENTTRLGLPVTVVPTHGWGLPITVTCRMLPLADVLLPAVETAGIGLRAYQDGATIKFDAYQPTTFPTTLTTASGIVLRAEASEAPPTVTRTVIGDAGSGESRTWRAIVDASVESDWGPDHVAEVLTDSSAETEPELATAGQETLTNGRASTGLSVELSETDHFRYGRHFRVGDIITVDVGLPEPVTDILRRATITWTVQDGLKVQPQVGDRADDTGRWLANQIAGLWRRIRDKEAR